MDTTEKKQQRSFDEEIDLPTPDVPQMPVRKKSKPRSTANAAIPEGTQPFLPGLSRRGRPRSKNPVPASVRASESRKRRIDSGAKRIELLLPSDVAAHLDVLMKHFHLSRAEIISRLVTKAARRLPPA